MADRDVLDVIEREIAEEVRTRFPGDAVRRVRLLQYGDHPMIEPGELWVRVLLAGDPEDYERILRTFQDAHAKATAPGSAGGPGSGWRTSRRGSRARLPRWWPTWGHPAWTRWTR